MARSRLSAFALGLFASLLASPAAAQIAEPPPETGDVADGSTPPSVEFGEVGEGVLAIRAAKVLTAARADSGLPQVLDRGVVLVRDGKILSVGKARDVAIPAGARVIDAGERWVMPGLVELHCHVAGETAPFPTDINDAVYLANPGLRASSVVIPDQPLLHRALAGGVTTVLFIPGSATNVGGQGVLLKLGHDTYEDTVIRDPGTLKLAQSGNPESWGEGGNGRSFQNWHTRALFKKGRAYARRWEAFEAGEPDERGRPAVDPMLEPFRALFAREAQVSTHTQFYQVVLTTITMVRIELGLDVFIDHGTFGGYKAAALAAEHGVQAIIGPRMTAFSMDVPPFEQLDTDGRLLGVCAEYQARGHLHVGFNTDCVDDGMRANAPAQEELSLQAAMAQRYGMTDFELESIRGLTIIPAETVGLGDRVGGIEPGKDADLVILDGDPADPRTAVRKVLVDGEIVYDSSEERLW